MARRQCHDGSRLNRTFQVQWSSALGSVAMKESISGFKVIYCGSAGLPALVHEVSQ